MLKSLRRRDILILLTFWLSAVCVIGLALMFFLARESTRNQSPRVYHLQTGPVTALNLFPVARQAAATWESDVQFVSASTTWTHASLTQLEQPVEWIYRFYSPGQQRIVFVIVTPDQRVIVRPHLPKIRRELRIINPSDWQVDSPTAIIAWLNEGGGDWLAQSAERVVSAQLTLNLAENRPEWTISGLNPETGQSVRYTLPAQVSSK